mmetsp:Transcript_10077/g.31951  ORF Transcript_10077/g.31951 Transcript_10077/m.31951 type:complete len:469 (+) Transcript_10077:84-1490(+)
MRKSEPLMSVVEPLLRSSTNATEYGSQDVEGASGTVSPALAESGSHRLAPHQRHLEEVPDQPYFTTYADMLEARVHGRADRRRVYFKTYLKILAVAALFYFLPSVQLVATQYWEAEAMESASDPRFFCYFNLKCANEALGFKSFNNIVSNIFYVLFGLSFAAYVSLPQAKPSAPDHGIQGEDNSLYAALGLALAIEGVMSALYHVCPSRVSFQFDSAFMLVGGGLLFLSIYAKRHPNALAGPFWFFGFSAVLILLNTASLFSHRMSNTAFWTTVCVLLVIFQTIFAYCAYYRRGISLNSLRHLCSLVTFKQWPPAEPTRLTTIACIAAVNTAMTAAAAIYALDVSSTLPFSNYLLGLITLDGILYLAIYIGNKYKHGEHVVLRAKLCFIAWLIIAPLAIYFFEIPVTNKNLTPAESDALNKPCVLFHYFDYHDIWHSLSAFATMILALGVFWVDDDLANTPHNKILLF